MQTTTEFLKLLFLSFACGAFSMTVSKAKIFAPFRRWVTRLSPFLGEGFSCPYCTSHWVALILMLIYFPRPLYSGIVTIDFFVTTMMLVALSSATARLIYSSYSVMAPADDLRKSSA